MSVFEVSLTVVTPATTVRHSFSSNISCFGAWLDTHGDATRHHSFKLVNLMNIELQGKYGGPRLRDGLVVALFKQGPFQKWSAEVAQAFQMWLNATGDEARAFASVGASSTEDKPVNARTIGRCRGMLDPKKAAARDLTAFNIHGPSQINADFYFGVQGSSDLMKGETNYFTMRFPSAWAEDGGDALAQFVSALAATVSFDSGYAGAALHWSVDAELTFLYEDVLPLAFRHPGFDMQDFDHAAYRMGDQIWGAQWMTLLGPDALARVCGLEALRAAVPDFTIEETSHGVLVRSPMPPRGGDTNRGDGVEELRPLARFLEPVTMFPDTSSFFIDPSDAGRWYRRFVDWPNVERSSEVFRVS